MGLDTCMKCLKYALFIFNFIFWLVGVVILAFGLYLLINPMINTEFFFHWPDNLVSYLHAIRLTLIVIGSIVMLLGFLGCCGAILENKCMLVVFFIVMTLIFLVLLTLGLLIVFLGKAVKETTVQTLHDQIVQEIVKYSASPRNETDAIQKELKCCGGLNGTRDYESYTRPIPESCKDENGNTYQQGCPEKLKVALESHWFKIIIALFTSALVTLFGMILSMTLCCALRDDVYD